MILPTNPNTEIQVTCRIRKRWMGDHGYVDIISPSGRVARIYKNAYLKQTGTVRNSMSGDLVTLIVHVEDRRNVVNNIDEVPSYADYDLNISTSDMRKYIDWPITELFESIEEADKQITTNIRVV